MEPVSRRVFLGAAAAGLGLAAIPRPVFARQSPNDTISIAMIGVGGMGTGRLKQFLQHPDVRIAAICDVDRRHVARAIAMVEKVRGDKPQGFSDYRRVLD